MIRDRENRTDSGKIYKMGYRNRRKYIEGEKGQTTNIRQEKGDEIWVKYSTTQQKETSVEMSKRTTIQWKKRIRAKILQKNGYATIEVTRREEGQFDKRSIK